MVVISMEDKEIELKEEDLKKVCRLCLQQDVEFSISVFDRIDPNPKKKPLVNRIFELFHVNVSKLSHHLHFLTISISLEPTFFLQILADDGLPTNICHSCLYHTETFYDYQTRVHNCERKLQDFVVSLGLKTTKDIPNVRELSPINVSNEHELTLNENVIVIDPTKFYASSDEDEEDAVEPNAQSFEFDLNDPYSMCVTPSLPTEKTKRMFMPKMNKTNMPEGFRNVFFCQYCEAAFVSREQCEEHENNGHDLVTPNVCNFCDFRCASRVTVIAHIKECHEPEKPFICVQCNKKFGRRSDLKKHSICHTGIRPFVCPVCNKSFSRNTNLTKHLKIHEGLKPFVCQQCPRSFSAKCDLQRHEQIHNENSKPFQCAKCPSTFMRRDKLLHHERKHLNNTEEANRSIDSENMIISLNPYQEMDHQSFDAALAAIQLQSRYNMFASKDSSTSATPSSSSANEISPEKQPPQISQLNSSLLFPNQGFPIPDHFTEDVLYPNHVTGDAISFTPNQPKKVKELPKTLACDKCPRKFNKQSALLNHKNVHLNQILAAPPVCSLCNKTFKSKKELDRHMLIHTGIKKFQCFVCLKRFLRKDKLVRHEKIHIKNSQPSPYLHSTFNKMELVLPSNTSESGSNTAGFNQELSKPQLQQQQPQLYYPHQQFFPQPMRPQFYAEYDINSLNNQYS